MRFDDLWRWEGTIGRGPYALIGLIGFGLKHNLDRFVATFVFGREWDLFNYWVSPFGPATLGSALQEHASLIAALLALAVPFLWVGVVLTMRRLRSIGWPIGLVVFFFFPFLNLVFFLLLCTLPGAHVEERPESRRRWLDAVVPNHPVGAAAMALLLTNLLQFPWCGSARWSFWITAGASS